MGVSGESRRTAIPYEFRLEVRHPVTPTGLPMKTKNLFTEDTAPHRGIGYRSDVGLSLTCLVKEADKPRFTRRIDLAMDNRLCGRTPPRGPDNPAFVSDVMVLLPGSKYLGGPGAGPPAAGLTRRRGAS